MSDPLENVESHSDWDIALRKLLKDTQNWIESEWNVSGSTPKTRLICRVLISSLEVISYEHTHELLKWISESISTRRDYVVVSMEESLKKEDQMNNGRRPWLVHQFKALL